MLSDFNLEGKTALVTGASSGIGKEIALVLAEAGADVAVAARRLDRIEETADEIRGLGRRAVPIQADVSDSQQVDDMVSQATESLARIDIPGQQRRNDRACRALGNEGGGAKKAGAIQAGSLHRCRGVWNSAR